MLLLAGEETPAQTEEVPLTLLETPLCFQTLRTAQALGEPSASSSEVLGHRHLPVLEHLSQHVLGCTWMSWSCFSVPSTPNLMWTWWGPALSPQSHGSALSRCTLLQMPAALQGRIYVRCQCHQWVLSWISLLEAVQVGVSAQPHLGTTRALGWAPACGH